MSHAVTGLVWEKRFGRSLLRADLHDNAVQTALPLSGLQLGLDGPRLFFCLFPRDVDGGPGPIPLRYPVLASMQSGLQTRGWCMAGRGSPVNCRLSPPLTDALFRV